MKVITSCDASDVMSHGYYYYILEIYRAVKMRIELNRTWQHQPSAYR